MAKQLNVSLPPEEVHVASVAATLLVRAMRTEEKELIGRLTPSPRNPTPIPTPYPLPLLLPYP